MRAAALLHDVSRAPAGRSATGETIELALLAAPQRDRRALVDALRRVPLRLVVTSDLNELHRLAGQHPFGWALIDLADESHALSGIRLLHARQPRLRQVGLVDESSAVTAAQARLAGVIDFLPWPIDQPALATAVADIRDRLSAAGDTSAAPAADDAVFAFSPSMQEALRAAHDAATKTGGVLLAGERGAGRRMLAAIVHARSPRHGAPFVTIDAAEADDADVEARLFGRLASAGPRASGHTLERIDRASALHDAAGGTLVVAHASSLSSRAQARLARLARDGEARLDDGARALLDVRLLATDADDDGQDGLRHDLRDYLGAATIRVPALRERRPDIPALAAHLLRVEADEDTAALQFSRAALTLLTALPWHGNGRELRTFVSDLARTARHQVIQIEDVLARTSLDGPGAIPVFSTLRDARSRFERDCITRVLAHHRGRMGEAARTLGIQRTNLYRKVRQLNLERALRAARK
jgi:DNA-binding NtrC family response regulator